MAPSSYKVVGLLSLLYSMTLVVANPVDLQQPSSLTAASVLATHTPSPNEAISRTSSGEVPDRHGTNTINRHGKLDPTQLNATEDSGGHSPQPPGFRSWLHPFSKLNARGGPATNGKKQMDPKALVATHNRLRDSHRGGLYIPRKRQVSSANPAVHSVSSAAVASEATVGASSIQGSASVTSSSAAATSTAKKRGILYTSASSANAFIGKPMISWASNWYSKPQSFSASGVEYFPLLWGPRSIFLSSWEADARAAIAAGATAVLGFYEPDQEKGANLSAADAATAYKQYITDVFGGSAKLGSVGVSNGAGSNQGLAYLSQFMSACSDCKIDFINIHWSDTYDSGAAQRFQNYVDSAWLQFQKPIWVGEFGFEASSPTADQENQFLKTVLPWLDQNQHVDRYAYYMASDMTSGGTLNSVGTTYATFT